MNNKENTQSGDAGVMRHEWSSLQAAATVAAAFASNGTSTAEDVVSLTVRLLHVFGSRAGEATQAATDNSDLSVIAMAGGKEPPAIPVENAVSDDKVFCLCCGRGFTMLKRHLTAEHGLTEDQYRALFGLPDSMPLVAPNYSARKAAYAKRVGLGKYDRDQNQAANG